MPSPRRSVGSSTRRTGTPTSEPAPKVVAVIGGLLPRCRRRSSSGAPDEHPRQVATELGRRVEIGRWLGAVARGGRGVGRRRAARAAPTSTPSARTGVEPMFTSATPGASPPTAATPTIAQSCARRLNFWNAQPAPLVLGTRTSVMISSGASAVSRKSWKKSSAAITRSPPLPRTTMRAAQGEHAPRAGRTRGRRARASRRACRGGGPAGRRPRSRPRSGAARARAPARRARRRGGG